MDFAGHAALAADTVAHAHLLTGPKLRHAEAAQRLHMDEDVAAALVGRQEAVALGPIEPFHRRGDEFAGRGDGIVGPRWGHLRGMHRRRLVHRQDSKGLQALLAALDFTDDTGAFQRCRVAVPPQTGDMEKNVRRSVVGNDEAEALRHVEPFDLPGHHAHHKRGLSFGIATEFLHLCSYALRHSGVSAFTPTEWGEFSIDLTDRGKTRCAFLPMKINLRARMRVVNARESAQMLEPAGSTRRLGTAFGRICFATAPCEKDQGTELFPDSFGSGLGYQINEINGRLRP